MVPGSRMYFNKQAGPKIKSKQLSLVEKKVASCLLSLAIKIILMMTKTIEAAV